MKIYLICGTCGSGKSTFVREASNEGFPTFHSGAVFKRLMKNLDASVMKGQDAESPSFADKEIHDSMMRFIEKNESADQVFIETVPRSEDSMSWISELIEKYGRKNVFAIWFDVDRDERIRRMKDRKAGRVDFDMERMMSEDPEKHERIKSRLDCMLGDNFRVYDGRPGCYVYQTGSYTFDSRDSIGRMMNSATNVYFERNGYEDLNAKFDRMVERMQMEIEEMKEATTDADRREEFADVMHFMFCVADSIGIKPDEIFGVFRSKTMKNQARLQFPEIDKHKVTGRLYGKIEE